MAKLKEGDLVKFVKSDNGREGHIAKIVGVGIFRAVNETDGSNVKVPYETLSLADGITYGSPADSIEPYTPKAGDEIVIDGVAYVLHDRGATESEKVLPVNLSWEWFTRGNVYEATKGRSNGTVVVWDDDGDKHALTPDHYLVLEPKQSQTFEWISAEKAPPFVVTFHSGAAFEFHDDMLAGVDDLFETYYDDETGILKHPQLGAHMRDIESITQYLGEGE